MISVYPSNEKLFADNGIKILKPMRALVRKEDNGDYYIDIKDTIENLQYYQAGMIIRVPTIWGKQCFRLTNPKIENKKIIIRGNHIYFDTKNYIIRDSYIVDKNCNDALDHLKLACDKPLPFTILSDVSTIASYRCVRKSYEEAVSSILERWGGHLVRNNFEIEVRDDIGQDRGVVLSYGKNITSIKSNEDWNNVVTKILPVGKDGLTLPEVYLTLNEDLYDIPYTRVIHIEQNEIEEDDYKNEEGELNETAYIEALTEDLRMKGNIYLQDNNIPKVNYTLSAYIKDISDIGDTIHVNHPKCKINLITNVIAIEYDVILERCTKIEFGNFKNKLKDLVSTVSTTVTKEVNQITEQAVAKLQNELEVATQKIKDTMGNSYVVYEGDKILIVDKLPKEEAMNVILINDGGIGFSQDGINGTFKSAWTIDGTMDMQSLNTINLVADLIKRWHSKNGI